LCTAELCAAASTGDLFVTAVVTEVVSLIVSFVYVLLTYFHEMDLKMLLRAFPKLSLS